MSQAEQSLPSDPGEQGILAFFRAQVCEQKGAFAAHDFGIAGHDLQVRADVGREVGFVNKQQIAVADGRPALAWDFVALGDVDDIDEGVDEFRGKGGGEVVAAAFDQNELGVGMAVLEIGDGGEVHAGVIADGGVWAAACFDAQNAVRREGFVAGEEFGVLAGVDVVGHDGEGKFVPEPLA